MMAMANAPHVIGSYVVTFGAIVVYVWRVVAGARRSARYVPPEDRPWT